MIEDEFVFILRIVFIFFCRNFCCFFFLVNFWYFKLQSTMCMCRCVNFVVTFRTPPFFFSFIFSVFKAVGFSMFFFIFLLCYLLTVVSSYEFGSKIAFTAKFSARHLIEFSRERASFNFFLYFNLFVVFIFAVVVVGIIVIGLLTPVDQ